MTDALRALARAFPWPGEKPDVDAPPQSPGWLGEGTARLLARELSPETRLVIELGSWLGLSTRFIADHAPNATIIAIDHWQGSPEHRQSPEWQDLLPRLHETFLALCWSYRERLVPLRMTTLAGLQTVADQGLAPDLIFIDAEHSYEAVSAELETAHRLFPRAVLVGDDHDWSGVETAVADFARRHGLGVETVGASWRAWKIVVPEYDAAEPESPLSIIDFDRVRAARHEPRYVTYVDPVAETGVYAFARIADELGRRRPDIPMLVVEGHGTEADLVACGLDLRKHGNVHLMAPTSDPRDIWGVTRLAVVPAPRWRDQPPSAIEAVVNGIPVLASDRSGLGELLGNAGVLLPLPGWLTTATRLVPAPEEVAPWVEAIIRLWDDPAFHAEHRRKARDQAERWRSGEVAARADSSARSGRRSERARWVVLVPFLSTIEWECEQALRGLEESGVHVVRRRGSSAIDIVRNELLSDALHDGAEAMLFVDADVSFDPRDALRLLGRPEPIVAGVYTKKARRELASVFHPGLAEVAFGPDAPGLYPLEHAAAGFLRIRAEVLRRMIAELSLPLCNTRWGRGFWPFFQPMIVPLDDGSHHYLGEDWAFSYRLHKIGVPPLADTSFRLSHIGSYGYTWEDAGAAVTRYRNYTYHFHRPSQEGHRASPASPPGFDGQD